MEGVAEDYPNPLQTDQRKLLYREYRFVKDRMKRVQRWQFHKKRELFQAENLVAQAQGKTEVPHPEMLLLASTKKNMSNNNIEDEATPDLKKRKHASVEEKKENTTTTLEENGASTKADATTTNSAPPPSYQAPPSYQSARVQTDNTKLDEEPESHQATSTTVPKPAVNQRSATFSFMKGFLSSKNNSKKDSQRLQELEETRQKQEKIVSAIQQQEQENRIKFHQERIEKLTKEEEQSVQEGKQLQERYEVLQYIFSQEAREVETAYCSAFFLQAGGGKACPYKIFFQPKHHSEETELIVRSQLEGKVKDYQKLQEAIRVGMEMTEDALEERRRRREQI